MSLLTHYEPKVFSTLLDEFFATERSPRQLSGSYPVVEVKEEKEHFVLTAEVPGLSKEDLSVEVKNGVLTLSGEKKYEKREKQEGYFYSERSYGRFERSFNLGENVSEEDVVAEYNNGLLKVALKKKQVKESRRIEVK